MSKFAAKKPNRLLIVLLFVSLCLPSLFSTVSAWTFELDVETGNDTAFDYIGWPDKNGISLVLKDGFYGLLNMDGTVVAEPVYQKIFNFRKPDLLPSAEYGCYVVEGNGYTGCLFSDGRFVQHDPSWNTDGTAYFSGETMIIQNKDTGASNFVNQQGKLVFDHWWQRVYPQKNGGGIAQSGNQFFAISHTGTIMFSFEWEGSISCHEDLIILHGNNTQKSCAISPIDGSIVVPAQFDYLDPRGFFHELLLYSQGKKYGYLNRRGEIIISPQFDYAWPFVNDLAIVEVDGNIGCIDMTGKMLFSFPSNEMNLVLFENYPQAIKYYKKNNDSRSCGFLNRDGEVISVFTEEIEEYSEAITSDGVFPATNPLGKAGYMNVYGQWVIEPRWDVTGDFTNGYAFVEIDSLCGVIDQSGNYVISPMFQRGERILVFQGETFFLVRLNQPSAYQYVCDETGKIIAPYLWNR